MRKTVITHDVSAWAQDFLAELGSVGPPRQRAFGRAKPTKGPRPTGDQAVPDDVGVEAGGRDPK